MSANDPAPSRRKLLKTGLAAAGAAAAALSADAVTVSAEADASALRSSQAPSQSSAVVTARRFRGWISRGSGADERRCRI